MPAGKVVSKGFLDFDRPLSILHNLKTKGAIMNYAKILKVIRDLTSEDLDALARGEMPAKHRENLLSTVGSFDALEARFQALTLLADLTVQEVNLLMKVTGDPDLLTLVEVAVDFDQPPQP